MKVQMERHVEQVEDGLKYKGDVKVAGVQFDYELAFIVPIPEIDDLGDVDSHAELRRRYQIKLKKGHDEIELSDDEYDFFVQLLTQLAVEFYHLPKTGDRSQSIFGLMLEGDGPVQGNITNISISSGANYEFNDALITMFHDPKFGCDFTAEDD